MGTCPYLPGGDGYAGGNCAVSSGGGWSGGRGTHGGWWTSELGEEGDHVVVPVRRTTAAAS